jgi:hypothetical protein
MEEPIEERIIVFESYDTVVKASLAKTKLDAYGIPCFLTEENLTSLYPVSIGVFPGVRLHIFERDLEEVKNVLDHQAQDAFIKCPGCGSIQLEKNHSVWARIAASAMLLVGIIFPIEPKEYKCHSCGKEFD